MRVLVAAGVLLMGMPSARADEARVDRPVCMFAGAAYSPGAAIRASDQVMLCGATGNWEPTKAAAAGCLRDGKWYGSGAVEGIANFENAMLQCRPDGTWDMR